MTGLIIPKSVAARAHAAASAAAEAQSVAKTAKPGAIQSDIDVTHPWLGEDVPTELMAKLQSIRAMHRFNLLVKRVEVKSKIGNIFIPDAAKHDMNWLQGLGVVVLVGPSVYRGAKFEDVGLTQDDAPKVGDAIWFNARVPLKVKIDGVEYLSLPDDAILMTIPREEAHRFSFNF